MSSRRGGTANPQPRPTRARSSTSLRQRVVVWGVSTFVLLTASFLNVALGQEWRVRRILVPQDSLTEVIEGQGSYLTVDRAKFDALIEAGLPANPLQDSLERFTHATFRGRLEADGTLRGQSIVALGAMPVDRPWIMVKPPAFWIGQGKWLESDGASLWGTHALSAPTGGSSTSPPSTVIPNTRSTLETFGPSAELVGRPLTQPIVSLLELPVLMGTAPDGRWVIERTNYRHMTFDWIVVGERATPITSSPGILPLLGSTLRNRPAIAAPAAPTDRIYRLQFPAAIASTWYLELPSELRPSIENGLTRPVWSPSRSLQGNTRVWRIDLGPQSTSELRLIANSPTAPTTETPLAPLEIESVCQIEPGLIELRTTIQWTDPQRDSLQWEFDSSWQQLPVILQTSEGERRVVPQLLSNTTDGAADSTSISVSRLTGLKSTDIQSLTLTFQRSYDFHDPLRVQAPLIDARWLSGWIEINRSPRLQLSSLNLSDGIWSRTSRLPDESTVSEAVSWRAIGLGPELAVEFTVEPQVSTIEGAALTTVQAEGGKVSAKLQAWLQPVGEPTFLWRTPLSDGWLVDRITATPSGDSRTTEILDSWDLVVTEDGRTWLEVRFAQAWIEGQAMQIVVEAHRPSFPSPLDSLGADTLRLVQWDRNALVRHWLGLQSENPYRFVSVGARMPRQVLPDVDPRIDAWFFENPTARLLDLEIDGDLQFALRTELIDQIAIDQEITATLFDRTAKESVILRCRPLGGRPNELNLTWERAPRGEWSWVLKLPNQNRTLPIQVLDRSEADSFGTTLAWGVGLSEPFVIEGTVVEPWEQQWSPSLPRVDGSRESTGILTVASMARVPLHCESDQSARLPASIARLQDNSRLLTVVDLGSLAFPVSVTRAPTTLGAETTASGQTALDLGNDLIESMTIESWPGAERTRHLLRVEYGSRSASTLSLRAPKGAELIRASADDNSVASSELERSSRTGTASTAAPPSGSTNSDAPSTATGGPIRASLDGLLPPAPIELLTINGSLPTIETDESGVVWWRWSLANRDPSEPIEVMFVTDDQLPRMRGLLNCPMPTTDLPVGRTCWKLHLSGSCEVELPQEEPQSLPAHLLRRWFGFEVRWQPIFEPFQPREFNGLEIEPSRTDPLVSVVGAGVDTSVVIRRPEVLRWWCIAALLLQSALWLTLLRRRVWMAPALVGTIALWVPAAWVDVTWTMVPAAILATLATVRWPATSVTVATRRETPAGLQRAAIASGVFLLLATLAALLGTSWTLALSAQGQESTSSAAPTVATEPERRMANVYIPIDENGNELQTVILVPKAFYDSLLKQAPQSQVQVPWIVESIRHTIDAEPNPFDNQTRLRLTSRYRIRTLENSVDWPIPLASDSLTIQADQVQADGSIARLSGTPDRTIRARLSERGVHDLVVTAIDLLREDDATLAQWELAKCLDAELRINGLIERGMEVTKPDVWLESDRLGLDRRSVPGPIGRFELGRRGSSSNNAPEVASLGVMTVLESNEDLGEMRVWISAGLRQTLPEVLQLRAIGDWELQSTTIPSGLLVESERKGSELSIEVSLSQQTPRPNLIGLTLRAPRVLSPGRHPLPVIQVADANIVARHLVWRQPNVALWSIESSRGTPLTGVDSLATWWPSEQLVAMRVLEGQRQVSARTADAADWIKVAPLEPIASIDHQWDVSYAPSQVGWSSSTVVSVRRGEIRSLQLTSSVPLEVDLLEMELPDGRRPIDVVRLSASRLLLLLPTAQRTTFTIRGSGRLRLRAGEPAPLPILSFPGFSDATYRGRYSRASDLHVELLENSDLGWTPLPLGSTEIVGEDGSAPENTPSQESIVDEFSQFAQRWRDERSAELSGSFAELQRWNDLRVRWRASAYPRLSQSTTRFERDASGWIVTVHLTVSEEEIWGADCFDVLLPEGFTPISTAGVGSWSNPSTNAANPIARWTAVRRVPPGGTATLSGRLTRFPDGRILPRVLAAQELTRIVELPTAGPNDPFLWKYDRYRPIAATEPTTTEVAETASNGNGSRQTTSWLRLLEEEPSASLRLASKPLIARPSRVFLAEHRASFNEQGARVTSRFLLDPGGRSRVRVTLPDRLSVLQVSIDGEARPIDSAGMIELTSRELPQELVVESWLSIELVSFDSSDQFAFWSDWLPSASAQAADSRPWDQSEAAESSRQGVSIDRDRGLKLFVPELDVPATRTIVAIRPDHRWSNWQAQGTDATLDAKSWRQSIDAATEEVRRSLATVAGLSPLAMERWSDAWQPAEGSAVVAAPVSRPALVFDDATGEIIWSAPNPSWPIDDRDADASRDRGWFRADNTLPADASAWRVWQWQEQPPQLTSVPKPATWPAKLLVSLGLIALAAAIGVCIRCMPLNVAAWIDLGCVLGGFAWIATVEPAGPGIVLLVLGALPWAFRALIPSRRMTV